MSVIGEFLYLVNELKKYNNKCVNEELEKKSKSFTKRNESFLQKKKN